MKRHHNHNRAGLHDKIKSLFSKSKANSMIHEIIWVPYSKYYFPTAHWNAIEKIVGRISGLSGDDLKSVMDALKDESIH